jgi:hypothetical protein
MNTAGTALSSQNCMTCPIFPLEINKKNLLEKSERSKKYKNRGEI